MFISADFLVLLSSNRRRNATFWMTIKLLFESLSFGWKAMVANRLRAALSLIGVTIGIMLVISVLTLVDAMESNIRTGVDKLGDNLIYVQRQPWAPEGDEYEWWKYIRRPNPELNDYEGLKNKLTKADAIAYLTFTQTTVEYVNSSAENVLIQFGSHDYNRTRDLDVENGRYFSQVESRSGSNRCVIGASVAEVLFDTEDPIGKFIKIRGQKLAVVGVLKREGESLLGNSMDNVVLVPVNYARYIFNLKKMEGIVVIKAKPNVGVEEMKDEVRGHLRVVRGLRPKEEDNFSLNEVSVLSEGLDGVFGAMNTVGWILGGFSLLVGGFGIANIMFVSVQERTRIIGIQKALGAKQGFILSQFLFEAVLLSLMGGGVGLSIVFLLAMAADAMMEVMTVVLTFENVFWGLFISTIIGVIAGIFPAWRAARLDPVEAMRH